MDNPSHSLICFKMVINHQPVFVFNSGDLGTRFFWIFFRRAPGPFWGVLPCCQEGPGKAGTPVVAAIHPGWLMISSGVIWDYITLYFNWELHFGP